MAEHRSKMLAFQRSVKEVQSMYNSLRASYSIEHFVEDMSRAQLLKRKTEQVALNADFGKLRDRVDKLSHCTDICFETKEETLDKMLKAVTDLGTMKKLYEDKLHSELVDKDLTEDKLKVAHSTKVNFGKFKGQLGEGDDFYTFKSKFLKAYKNHPKDRLADLLKENHLEGIAKSVVGSLDDINLIWERLKDNFGNTEEMLLFHFSKINKMGVMSKQKSLESKKLLIK